VTAIEPDVGTRVRDLHERAIVVNGLASSQVMPRAGEVAFDVPAAMREGGVSAVNFTVSYEDRDDFGVAAAEIAYVLRAIDETPSTRLALTVDDIRAAKEAGEAAIVLGFQNATAIEDKLPYLEVFHRLGLRVMQLTYQRRNLLADGCGETANAGLSTFGRQVVAEMNRLGILIDLSHTGERSTLETIELSAAPVAITHACLQKFNPTPRNKTDEEVKALAGRGGVFGMNSIARFVSAEGKEKGATIEQFADQIDYLVELVGADHVGIGLDINEGLTPELFEERRRGFLKQYSELAGGDFPYEHYYVFGLTSMANTVLVTETLVDRGYSDDDVLKILGGNFLRLFEQVWQPVS
jgi:membrane dipeptidase